MHRYIKYMILLPLFISGCDDLKFGNNFLEKPISDEMNIDSVYSKKIFAEQALAQVYHSLPDFQSHDGRMSAGVLESVTDLADFIKSGGATGYHDGSLTPSTLGSGAYDLSYNDEHGSFSASYGIRKAWLFIENVDRVPDMTDEEKKIRKAEAMMIIAYHYVDMFRNLGGMPWIDHAYDVDEEVHLERMTVEETVKKICELIDQAASVLPWQTTPEDDGRMTAAGALALKSRLLQFAASPLFNDDQPYREGKAADLHYVWYGNKSQSRWQDALDAGLAFLRENGDRYKLVDTGNPRKDFDNAYFTRYNGEILISSHRFTKWDHNCKAVSQIRYGVCSPLINYADMFQMKDGSKFSWDNPEHRKHPFFDENGKEVRDPRLYETLWVTGDKLEGRKYENFQDGRDASVDMSANTSGKLGGIQGFPGIAQRKFTHDFNTQLGGKFYVCPLLRLPEIYLNIAEAMNELGLAETSDEFGRTAYDYVNLVRERVDMPGLTREQAAPGIALREAILHERALEFGYEEVRYFDIVRWKHKDYLDVPRRRLKTWLNEGETAESVRGNADKHVFRYEITEEYAHQRVWVQKWDNKYYLSPISQVEINKKYGLIQNPGWE